MKQGFSVVEVGKKVDESNAEEACKQIYDRLNAVFVGMAPIWLQELASLADGLRGSLQELEVLDSRLRGVADRLIYLIQQRSR